MAQKTDIAAAKARKQKIILAAAGVALVGLAVIQVPKLMKSDSQPVAAAPAATAAREPRTGSSTTVVVSSTTGTFKPAGYVAGVALPGGSKVVVADGQARVVHALRGEGSVRPAGVDETTTTSESTAAATTSSRYGTGGVELRHRRDGTPADEHPAAAAGRLRDDHPRRQAAAGAGEREEGGQGVPEGCPAVRARLA